MLNMLVAIFLTVSLPYLVFSQSLYNVYKEKNYGWSFADRFLVNNINSDDVIKRVDVRSFVECCIMCDVWTGCKAVAYMDTECLIMNTEVMRTEENKTGEYQVMVFSTQPQPQVIFLICYKYSRAILLLQK